MAFTVEDGTGVTGANSYMTVDEFKAYHAERGTSTSALGSSGDMQKLLVQGADYIEQHWDFKGVKEFADDPPLSFPRMSLRDRNGDLVTGIPDKLKWAQAEYALQANEGDLFLTPTQDASGLQLTKDLKRVGPLTTEKQYTPGSVQDTTQEYPKADKWLREYVVPRGGTSRA